MRIGSARHRHRIASVFEPVRRLVFDRRARRLLAEIGSEAAALDHEPVDHPVEQGVVEMARTHIGKEIGHGLGRAHGVELERDRAMVGVQDHSGVCIGHCAPTTVACLMITRSTGTSLGNVPAAPVGAVAILLTTSIPATTLPNTVYP